MKYIVSFLMIAALLLSCVGCGKKAEGDTAATTTAAGGAVTTVITTPPTSAVQQSIGWVTADSMHVRSAPEKGNNSIGGVKYGDVVTILEKEGDWFKIEWAKDPFYGYVSAQFVVFEDPATMTTTATTAETTVAATTTVAP